MNNEKLEAFCENELRKMFEVRTKQDAEFMESVKGVIKFFYEKGFEEGMKEAKKERG